MSAAGNVALAVGAVVLVAGAAAAAWYLTRPKVGVAAGSAPAASAPPAVAGAPGLGVPAVAAQPAAQVQPVDLTEWRALQAKSPIPFFMPI